MSAHKFKIGQFVSYNPVLRVSGVPRLDHPAGVYQVVQLMPPAGGEPQYRIKSELEGHLRSAMESDLSPLNRF